MTLSPLVTKEVTKIRFKTLESDFNKVHNFKYVYSKVVYLNMKSNIKIICPIHGEFTQIAGDHLSGRGCRKCAGKYKPSLEEFILSAEGTHKDKYDYSKFIYISKDKVGIIKCNTCGNIFEQSPHNHVYHKKGCKVCGDLARRAKYFNRATTLYYVTFKYNNNLYYKIGITTYSVERRFGTELKNIVESKSIVFNNGKEAYELEQLILNNFKEFRYEGEALIRGGNTEIFTVDIWEDIAEYFNRS